jgi:hypothetical protein
VDVNEILDLLEGQEIGNVEDIYLLPSEGDHSDGYDKFRHRGGGGCFDQKDNFATGGAGPALVTQDQHWWRIDQHWWRSDQRWWRRTSTCGTGPALVAH